VRVIRKHCRADLAVLSVKALVIGYGSIGKRHADILKGLGCEVAVVSHHKPDAYKNIPFALKHWRPEYAVVASKTADHYDDMWGLLSNGYEGRLLVEKPLLARPVGSFSGLSPAVGYNLRFHPVIQALKARLEGATIYQAHFHVGQWLPDWRPNRDYRDCDVSGVLRDLSHELDLLLWLCGDVTTLYGLAGKLTGLDINHEDCASILCETERCAQALISMNYVERIPRRQIVMVTDEGTLFCDLIQGTITDGDWTEQYNVARDDTYRDMHVAMLKGKGAENLCSLADGLKVVNLISLIESARNAPYERAA
jgi:predicted dehydrogenase